MNIKRNDRAAAMPHGDLDVFWYALDGASAPADFQDVAVFDDAKCLPGGSGIVLAPLAASRIGEDLRAIRAAIGEETYLIAVLGDHLSAVWLERVIELGADDVVLLSERPAILLSLARARRVVSGRARTSASLHDLAEQRDYLQYCIDNLPAPVFFKGADGVYLGCNKAFEAYIGLSAEQIIGGTVYDVAPPHLAQTYDQADRSLLHSGGVQIYEAHCRFADGSSRVVSYQKAVMTDRQGRPLGIAGAMLDITERKALEAKLIRAAERDPLTDSYNRRKFFELAVDLSAEAHAAGRPVSVAVIDIDHFKSVNDRFGHHIGDQVLCRVARHLERQIGEGNVMARAGGEEFFVLLPGHTISSAGDILDAARQNIAAYEIECENATIPVTISLGLALYEGPSETIWDVLKKADRALYSAKNAGRNRIVIAA
ncbi:diguanylate cyclase [Agrobacterium sp. a22-2]|uniref:sensor domain-containing diguanylate cyclase n=1 Tax=Agrobacterium sp. a22-2 TaxID=2283840 RepID=UPI0014480AE5|nr:GGDEF domain-containing protein [Agrobacterium sp. a22-2]NKN37966.1 diguanylate cyclase [Agrobacterium sp. a22-2]